MSDHLFATVVKLARSGFMLIEVPLKPSADGVLRSQCIKELVFIALGFALTNCRKRLFKTGPSPL
jgi:hypothetical protein